MRFRISFFLLLIVLISACSHEQEGNADVDQPRSTEEERKEVFSSILPADSLKALLFGRYVGNYMDGKLVEANAERFIFMLSGLEGGSHSSLHAYRFGFDSSGKLYKQWEWGDSSEAVNAGTGYIKSSLRISDWNYDKTAEATFLYLVRLEGMHADTLKMLVSSGNTTATLSRAVVKSPDDMNMYVIKMEGFDKAGRTIQDSALKIFHGQLDAAALIR